MTPKKNVFLPYTNFNGVFKCLLLCWKVLLIIHKIHDKINPLSKLLHYIDVFIIMKTKSLSIRITEYQFKILCDRVIEEQLTISNLVRNLIENDARFYRKDLSKSNCSKNNKNLDLSTNIKNYEK